MVIEKILKQLTPARIKKEVEAIQKIELPPELQKWVKEYEKVGERDDFIWKWIYLAIQLTTFPIIPSDQQKPLQTAKFLSLMVFTVLINDVADNTRKKTLLEMVLRIPFCEKNSKKSYLHTVENNYLICTEKIWKQILKIVRKFPRYSEFKNIFEFDIFQLLTAQRYDRLIANSVFLPNQTEYEFYSSITMGGMLCGTLDVMCSSRFSVKEIGKMRDIVCYAQMTARIGNWITTWEREMEQRDFTSGIFSHATNNGNLLPDELKMHNKKIIIEKIKSRDIEKILLQKWENCIKKIDLLSRTIHSVKLKKIIPNLEKLLILELCSRNFK